jgi:RNA polymerase sigma-70 factor (ECF subfamily)
MAFIPPGSGRTPSSDSSEHEGDYASASAPTVAVESVSWREWYEAHASRLLLYVRQWLPRRQDAEDAVQAGFVKFWKHRPDPVSDDTPLLYATVRCAALDLLKSQMRAAKRESDAGREWDDRWWDAPTLEEQERAQVLQKAMQRLSEDHREVLLLKIWAEMTFAEIAQTLNENQNTVAARYRYALANLKKLLPEDCHERV